MISSLERSSSSAVLGSGAGSVGASSSLKSGFVFRFLVHLSHIGPMLDEYAHLSPLSILCW